MTERNYIYNQPFALESGEVLPQLKLNYTTSGILNSDRSNVVWVCHALTGNSNPSSWWSGLIGKGKHFDPAKHFIVCANTLGSCYGSTGPLTKNVNSGKPYFGEFPHITIRDIVGSLELLRQHLGLANINTLIGGSLGGQQAAEWSIQRPELFENLVLVATNAQHSPWGIAFNESQRLAIQADQTWGESYEQAGQQGLKAARSIALLSYRNYRTYQITQIDNNEKTDDYRASSYQQYQGEKFIKRFNAYSYWTLSKAMDSHDVSRNRGTLYDALQRIKANTKIIAINSDVLFPAEESEILSQGITNSELHVIESDYGHDGFLLETEKISSILNKKEFIQS